MILFISSCSQRPRVQRSYTQISGEDILDGYSICDKLKEPRYALREESCQGLVDHLPDGMGECTCVMLHPG